MSRKKDQHIRDQALEIFREHGGILRTFEALALGIHQRILSELLNEGLIEKIGRGIYSLPGMPGISQPDFVTVIKKVPTGVICLVSALYFHDLTVRIPRWVDVAVFQSYRPPEILSLPTRFHWFSDKVFRSGIEKHDMGGVVVKIYSSEKTIVDCFRLRNKVGKDVAVEALKTYWQKGNANLSLLKKLAEESRVLKIMTPYIESIIHDQS